MDNNQENLDLLRKIINVKVKKVNVKKTYNLPKNVEFCKSCVVSNQRPRISFNKDGICNACVNLKNKNKINWGEREKELKDLLSKYKKKWQI